MNGAVSCLAFCPHSLKYPEVADGGLTFKWRSWPQAVLKIWYNQAVRSHVLPPPRARRTALSSIPGWILGGTGVCLAVWLQPVLLRIQIWNWSQGLAQFVFCAPLDVRVQIQQVLWKKVCVGGHIWLYSKRSSTGGITAYFTPCVSFPWLLKFCANYTSESLASPLHFSLAFSFTFPSPCARFPCLKSSSQSRWVSSSPPPSSALYISRICLPHYYDRMLSELWH